MRPALLHILAAFALWLATALAASAASSPAYVSDRLTARLITAENGVAPDAGTISAALQIELADGWHSYWKSPGAVGYPPSLDWSGAANVADAPLQWPVPQRFSAFDIENYGYKGTVTHPIQVTLAEPGKTTVLTAEVDLLVCAELCVPETFTLSLALLPGEGIDREAGQIIAEASDRVPQDGALSPLSLDAAMISEDGTRLSATVTGPAPLDGLSAFPDLGTSGSFGPPEIMLSEGGRVAQIAFDVLTAPDPLPPLELTVATGDLAARFETPLTTGAPAAMPAATQSLAWIFLLAFIGGVILNVMPCVLPVLTIKFASALKLQDQGAARIRTGFLASAAGVLAFMWALAAILMAVRAGGGAVGWGIQFQSPLFLSIMAAIITLFAANMFGLFEIALPQGLNTQLANAGARDGLLGDFATGALAAVLATPCSAPFLGTAVTFALAGSGADVLVIFTALGLGLALPYLLVALFPRVVTALPKPGAWMGWVRWAMGLLLAATAIWLIWVLSGVIGPAAAGGVAALLLAAIAALAVIRASGARRGVAALLLLGGIAIAATIPPPAPATANGENGWVPFDMTEVSTRVAEGDVVFIDVTADWCLTCKANKSLVLDRDPVAGTLEQIVAMQADWTRPDPAILDFLQSHNRFGIPFNIVYGPAAPEGVVLPELLTTDGVMGAIREARGS